MLVKCEVNVNINIFNSDCWGERTYVILSDFSVAFCSRNYKNFFFWSMARDEASLMKLNKEELLRITMDYQGKFDGVLDDYLWLKNDLSGLKSDFSKLEADIQVIRNINTKLSEPLVAVERRCYASEQYSWRECLEILGIPASVADNNLESKVLEILEEIHVPIDPLLGNVVFYPPRSLAPQRKSS